MVFQYPVPYELWPNQEKLDMTVAIDNLLNLVATDRDEFMSRVFLWLQYKLIL